MLNVGSGSSVRLRLAGWEEKTADAVVKNAPAVRGTGGRLAIGERNFQSPGWGGSLVGRRVSAGFSKIMNRSPGEGRQKAVVWCMSFIEKQSFMYTLIRWQKTTPFTRSLPPLNRGSNTVIPKTRR